MPVYDKSFETYWQRQQEDPDHDDRENKSPNNPSIRSIESSSSSADDDRSTGCEDQSMAAVDDLVFKVHKLQLKNKHHRAVPYDMNLLPRKRYRIMNGTDNNQRNVPSQLLLDLLKEGSLIKEAVKRLQSTDRQRRHSSELNSSNNALLTTDPTPAANDCDRCNSLS